MDVRARRVRRYGNRCLRRRAEPVDPAAPETRRLLDELWTTLGRQGGVGLAAPQIDRLERVVIVQDPERPAGKQRIELVNPVIRETFGPRVPFEEGCLSFPGLYTRVWRPKGVVVGHEGSGGSAVLREEGLAARIIQHEVDHLDGILFIDHLSRWSRFSLAPRLLAYGVSETVLNIFGKEGDGA